MAKEFAKKFYRSKAWLKCRIGYIQSVDALCETCLRKGRITPGYIVHHKIPLTPSNISSPYITLDWSNLEYNCLLCHNEIHMGSSRVTEEGLMFDIDGNLIER